ncbi:MAG: NAD(P)/FAD-dependent oxidoreductase [Paludibaculum sp.]
MYNRLTAREIMRGRDLTWLARQVLALDHNNEPLLPFYQAILEKGLPPHRLQTSPRVVVVGAGVAGLLAARLLKRAGFIVTVLEANSDRVGGRVRTFCKVREGERHPFSEDCLYGEAGAMRIPSSHKLVNSLIRLFNLQLRPFVNTLGEYDSTLRHSNGETTTARELGRDAKRLGFKLPTDPGKFMNSREYIGKSPRQILDRLIQLDPDLNAALPQNHPVVDTWKTIINRFDAYSVYRFLYEALRKDLYERHPDVRNLFDITLEQKNPIERVIAYIGTFENLTSRLSTSFLHFFINHISLLDDAGRDTSYFEIQGGMWKLPYCLLNDGSNEGGSDTSSKLGKDSLLENVLLGARVTQIRWPTSPSESEALNGTGRIWTTNNPSYRRTHALHSYDTKHIFERELTADYVLLTLPFSALRWIEIDPPLHHRKSYAVQVLHYDSATKVLLEFSERFWEFDEKRWREAGLGQQYRGHAHAGGRSITDGPNRFIYFPSNPDPSNRSGVVLASYTFSDDANRWDSMPDDQRLDLALRGLVKLYGPEIKRFYTGRGATKSWMSSAFSCGEAAVFNPGQLADLHGHISCPEQQRMFFAGEHTSMRHAWIEGAVESAIRAAVEIWEQANEERLSPELLK